MLAEFVGKRCELLVPLVDWHEPEHFGARWSRLRTFVVRLDASAATGSLVGSKLSLPLGHLLHKGVRVVVRGRSDHPVLAVEGLAEGLRTSDVTTPPPRCLPTSTVIVKGSASAR